MTWITSHKKGFFIPVEKLQELYNSSDKDLKFNFTYNRVAEPWAQEYKNTWAQNPFIASTQTLTAGGIGYLAYRGVNAFPKFAGVAAALGEAKMLFSDVGNLLESTDPRDKLKYSIAGAADLAGVAGGLSLLLSRNRVGGAIGLGIGVAGRIAAEFIPTRLVLTDLERKGNPILPPFDQNIEKTLGF